MFEVPKSGGLQVTPQWSEELHCARRGIYLLELQWAPYSETLAIVGCQGSVVADVRSMAGC